MLNILATIEKKKILNEYRLRLAVISFFAIGALVFSSLVLLVPSYFLEVIKYNDANNTLLTLQEKDSSAGNEKDVDARIIAVNRNIDLFLKAGPLGTSVPTSSIGKILDLKGSAIKIVGFTYDAGVDQERIVITGTALDRYRLAQFIEALKKEPTFTSVDLPISSYVKSNNIDFSAVIVKKAKK